MSRTRFPHHSSDGWLYALGVAGFLAFFLLLPALHPDAGADYSLGNEGARQAAADFLMGHGYSVENLTSDVSYRREGALLDSLQQDLTRASTVSFLKEDTTRALPVYYWEVEWHHSGGEEDGRVYRVLLNEHGKVWGFEKGEDVRARVDRNALLGTLKDPARETDIPALPDAITDSLLRAALAFSKNDFEWRQEAEQASAFSGSRVVLEALQPGATARGYVQMGPDWAVALARYHVKRSALGTYDFQVDSVWTVNRTDGDAARVRFVADLPYGGEMVQTDVEVGVTGALLGMNTVFDTSSANEGASKGEQQETVSITFEGTLETLSFVTYFVLVIIFLFLFLRRLHARAIDIKVALRDAFWGGVFAAAVMALTAGPSIVHSIPNFWVAIFIAALATLLVGAGGAIIVFIASNVADSITRGAWPEKLDALTLVRMGFFRNVPVGLAFLRGAALCGIMLGIIIFGLVAFPEIRFSFSDSDFAFLYHETPSATGYLFSMYGYGGLLMSLLILSGVGTLLYQWRKSALVVISGLAAVLVLVVISPVQLAPAGYSLALAGGLGTTMAVAYWRYDVVACFVGYLLMGIFWGLVPGWLIPASPLELDTWIALALLGVCVVIGLVGVLSRKTGAELPSYVPSYVQELAQEERLKSELEIAHTVQESFLPRRMPQVEGLDVAGMCLAAQEVGGDYYDFVELDSGRLGLVIGDVSGKGIQAAFYMTLVKGFFLTLCRVVESPAEVLRRLNTLFCENVPRGMFISLIYGVIDAEARTFTFARAGHNPVIIKRSPSQEPEMVQPRGMAIGLASGPLFDETIEEAVVQLRTGDVLVMYTDGFSEAMNAAKQQYGDSRLARKVGVVGQRSAAEILRAVSEDVHRFLEAVGRHDDMTMVVVKLEHPPGHVISTSVRKESAHEGQVELET